MQAFFMALGMNFLAEFGDKTQLVALSFATRLNPWVVFAGVVAASAASQSLSAALGGLIGNLLPTALVRYAAGLAFLLFGLWTLKAESDGNGEARRDGKSMSPFWLVATTFFLAELGDKTMLSNVALAASYSVVLVAVGGTVGMCLSDGLAIMVGRLLYAKLPERVVKLAAALLFFGFGVSGLLQGTRAGITPVAHWVAGVLIAAAVYRAVSGRAAQQRADASRAGRIRPPGSAAPS